MSGLEKRLRERGESVIAALVLAGIAGSVLLALQHFSPPAQVRLSQAAAVEITAPTAAGASVSVNPGPTTGFPDTTPSPQPPTTTTDTETNANPNEEAQQRAYKAECIAGQVHTIFEKKIAEKTGVSQASVDAGINDMGTTKTGTQTTVKAQINDEVVTCFEAKDPKYPSQMSSVNSSNPACAVADKTACVVRYCPEGVENPRKDCYKINCKKGAKECLRDNLGQLLTGNSVVEKIADLKKAAEDQGSLGIHTVKDEVFSADNLKSRLSPDAWKALEVKQELDATEYRLEEIRNSLKTCDESWFGCSQKGVKGPGFQMPGTDDLFAEQTKLEARREQLQGTFDNQMNKLAAAEQGSVADVTGSTKPYIICDPYKTNCAERAPNIPQCGPGYQFLFNTCVKCDNTASCGQSAPPTTTAPPGTTPPPVPPHSPPPGPYPTGSYPAQGPGNSGLMRAATQSGLFYQMGYMLGSLLRNDNNSNANTASPQVAKIACAKNADQYNDQIRQYNEMVQQFNQRLQQMQNQCQQSPYGYGGNGSPYGYGGYGQDPYGYGSGGGSYGFSYSTAPVGYPTGTGYGSCAPGSVTSIQKPPMPPQPCYDNANPAMCKSSPQRPQGQCNGTWKPLTASQNGCVTGWQCVPGSGTDPVRAVAAQISCQPQVADKGMTIAISFGCQNATASVGAGFDTKGQLAGSATTSVPANAPGGSSVRFGVTCTGPTGIANSECSVQIAKPAVALVANPSAVQKGKSSIIGWITSGMQSCVVSNPDLPAFTQENADNTSVNGVAQTPALSTTTIFRLDCVSVSGNEYDDETTVTVLP